MAQYDPQRSRSRHRSGEDEGPAPVDALLESAGATDPSPPSPPQDLIDLTDTGQATTRPDTASTNGAGAAPWSQGAATPSRPAPTKAVLAAIVLVAGLVLAWAWVRRRRQPPTPD